MLPPEPQCAYDSNMTSERETCVSRWHSSSPGSSDLHGIHFFTCSIIFITTAITAIVVYKAERFPVSGSFPKRKLHPFQSKLQALRNILKATLRDWWWKVHLHIYVSFATELWNAYNKSLAQISKKTNKSKMRGNNASVKGWSAHVCNPANSLTAYFRSLRTQGI